MTALTSPNLERTEQRAAQLARQLLLQLSVRMLRRSRGRFLVEARAACDRLIANKDRAWASPEHAWQAMRGAPLAGDSEPWCEHVAALLDRAHSAPRPQQLSFSAASTQASWALQSVRAMNEQLSRETQERTNLELGHPLAADAEVQLSRAWDTLAQCWPEASACVRRLVTEVVWFSGDRYFSSTAPFAFGAVFVNPRVFWRLPHYIETLLHEGGHLELMAEQADDPLLLNGEQLARSPLRDDARPLSAVLHAVFVLTRMVEGHRRYLATPGELPDREIAHGLLATAQRRLTNSMETLRRYAQPTARGELFLSELEESVSLAQREAA